LNEKALPVIMNRSSASGHFACRIEAPLIPRNGDIMRIHVGCELSFDFPQTMPMIATLNVHFSRFSEPSLQPPARCTNDTRAFGCLSKKT
jgi:hypothetical protein